MDNNVANRIKQMIKDSWDLLIDRGYVTHDKMISDINDMIKYNEEYDELTEEYAHMLGWNFKEIETNPGSRIDEWNDFVDKVAEEWIKEQ